MFTKIDNANRDFMPSLSARQRRHALLQGYVRSIRQESSIPNEIQSLCVEYMSNLFVPSRSYLEAQSTERTPLRITVFGAGAVGKSATVIQYILGDFFEEYDPTIEDSYRKMVQVDGYSVCVDVLDTAGYDCWYGVGDPHVRYMRESDAILFLYSIDRRESFDALQQFHKKLQGLIEEKYIYKDTPLFVAGNKSDLHQQRQVSYEEAEQLAKEWKAGFLEISAKDNVNVHETFEKLLKMVKAARPEECHELKETQQAGVCHCSVL